MTFSSAQSFNAGKAVLGIAVFLMFSAVGLAGQKEQAFKGEITDSACSGPAGPTATLEKDEASARSTMPCAKMGAKYVLSDATSKAVYKLDDQIKPKAFGGQNVVVIGTLDEPNGTIHVTDIFPALSPKVSQARSVFIVCDECPKGMAAASPAAHQELSDWKRFRILPDRTNANLIFLFSAKPYLGDYVTRDGPGTRAVYVKITYLNVIDPGTGKTLWSDSREWGSWRVGGAAKDLIDEFRGQLEANEGHVERLLLLDTDEKLKIPETDSK
jgi:hypothetical protein